MSVTSPTHWRIRTKLLILIILLAIASVVLFFLLWHQQHNALVLSERIGLVDYFDEEAFEQKARTKAQGVSVPLFYEEGEGKNDPALAEATAYCHALSDQYTSVYIYGLDDGLYRAGSPAQVLQTSWLNTIWPTQFEMLGEEMHSLNVTFVNGTYEVIVQSFRGVLFTYPYLAACFLVSVGVFLGGILLFVRRLTRRVHIIEGAILQMAGGDLETSVPDCGEDEIGTAARELDNLREALYDNIAREQAAQTANRDLITALSHDLRTPLTVLIGYLEVMQHNDAPDNPYTMRCLKKAEEMKILTNHLFDAALTEKISATPTLIDLPLSAFAEIIQDNIDFLRACGFAVQTQLSPCPATFIGDTSMLQRICDNLFSNIVKYGDKGTPVCVSVNCTTQAMKLILCNKTKSSLPVGHHIGLENVRRMLACHAGSLQIIEELDHFSVTLTLPLIPEK